MLRHILPAPRHRARQFAARLMRYALLTALAIGSPFSPAESAQPAESLSTGIVPTMGINEVTEGTLLFRTNQTGRFRPAPVLKTDVQIAITGTIARATVRKNLQTRAMQKAIAWKASMSFRCRRRPPWIICA